MSCFDDDVIVCVCTAGPDIGADFRVQHMLTFGVSYGGLLHPMTAMHTESLRVWTLWSVCLPRAHNIVVWTL